MIHQHSDERELEGDVDDIIGGQSKSKIKGFHWATFAISGISLVACNRACGLRAR